ncbi:MAG: tetratricopeptide repeat protein [Magnetospirillum sp.]|nr:tetratricopeptide repeat protein [Magnetospirillum sp.]
MSTSSHDETIAQLNAVIADHRALLEENPGTLYPAFADALMSLAAHLAESGQTDEALSAAMEGVEQFQSLAAADAPVFAIHLAAALNNLSNRLSEAGRDEHAHSAGDEAVKIATALLAGEPLQARFVLVSALMNQAGRSWRGGQGGKALDEMREAVDAFRAGGDDMAPYLGAIIEALHRNALSLSEAGLWTEAIRVRRMTAQCFAGPVPAPVHHLLALNLEQAAHAVGAAGRWDEAMPLIEEAVTIARGLAGEDADQYRLFLAQSLSSLASRRHEAGLHAMAMDAAVEAINLFQQVAMTDADSAVLPLILTLETFASILKSLGHHDQAATVLDQRDTLVAAAQAIAEEHGGSSCGSGCGCH